MKVSFFFQKNITLKQRTQLKQFLEEISVREKTPIDRLTIIFCSDDYILEINKEYLNHDYYTDIITFDLTENKTKGKIAELYISVDTIQTNAQQFYSNKNNELHRVIFHGLLHLCGYKDKTVQQKKEMRKKEDFYLSLYF